MDLLAAAPSGTANKPFYEVRGQIISESGDCFYYHDVDGDDYVATAPAATTSITRGGKDNASLLNLLAVNKIAHWR